jgi:hypothetical protein
MSANNGDKARFGTKRKRKIANRERIRNLAKPAPAPAAAK